MSELTAIEKVRLARDQQRPHLLDLVEHLFDNFLELHGDRRYADDAAMVAGAARLGEFEVMMLGQQKGRTTKERHRRNFGMSKPEGYRKALRLMHQAEKFGRPIISVIDTSGAYPGIDAEERGQAEAIAFNLREMANLSVPIIVVVLGEGGSGGALAIGVGDRILMLENSVYSVITPEGCAAILWKDAAKSDLAAESLRLTAQDLQKLNLIDEIIVEPTQWNPLDLTQTALALQPLKTALVNNLEKLSQLSVAELLENRWSKFRRMGHWLRADSI